MVGKGGFKMRQSWGGRLFDIANHCLMVALMVVAVYPLYYVLMASLSEPTLLVRADGFLLRPAGFSTAAYRMVLSNPSIRTGFINTVIYVALGVSINLTLTSFGAYALSRRNLPGRNLIMLAIVFTMFFSGGLIPTFLLVRSLGLLDTRWAVLLPVAINTWNLIIMRTVFMSTPPSLEEAAKLDGANDFQILFWIYLPVNKAVLAVMALFYSVQHWNSYFNAMIYLSTRDLYPIQLVLREILIASSTDTLMGGIVVDREPIGETIKFATIIVATVPILVVYPFVQKYFVKGVMLGSIKG